MDSIASAFQEHQLTVGRSESPTVSDLKWSGHSPDMYLCLDANETNDEQLTVAFESEWGRGHPVVIRNVHRRLEQNLWSPQSFSHDFGTLQVDLVNCRTNRVLVDQPLSVFWSGFDDQSQRPLDQLRRPMILKLKDWPTSDDFKHMLPSRFADLMEHMPIKDYVHRTAPFNLVSYLPASFCLPDLGPKLYVAYSSASTPKDGTTNLHVDISDAVNLLIYASDLNANNNDLKEQSKDLLALIENCGCSPDQIERIRNGEIPGALWHLFKPKDADEIRTFFIKVIFI